MKKQYLFVILISLLVSDILAQKLLQSGPLVGYSAMREVCLWVQTTKPARVKFAYWDITNPKRKYFTHDFLTSKEAACTAKLYCTQVDEGKKYNYELYIDGKKINLPYELKFQTQKLWQWRGDAPDISFIAGSCAYINEERYDRPGKPYGADYEIFKSIYEKKPEFMIWLGDNYYLREVDWDSWNGIVKRITHGRSIPELQPLWGSVHHYAIWDDHDFGPNDSDRGFWNKEKTLDAFKLFWPNPSFGINGKPGVTTFFQWGDLDFFMLDDRYYKTPNDRKDEDKTILGEEQINWLIDNLVYSQAPFKIIAVGSQFLNTNTGSENFSRTPKEKERILKAIDENKIEGVVFLTGDVHRAEISKLEREGAYPIYDFTTSPLTAGPSKNYPNSLRIESTIFVNHNFAKFDITGPSKNRNMKCTLYDSFGKEVWSFSLNENELKYKK
jgi:alkaline phosphatase D